VKALRILAFAVVALSSSAFAAPDDAPPKVELPLGPYVRPGRPLDVRVVGGADRVRAPGTPWALPQGDRGDEFILQLTEATAGVLSLEIERGGRVERTSMTVETLPEDGRLVGVRGDDKAPSGSREFKLPTTGLPTVREAWLLLDDVAGAGAPQDAHETPIFAAFDERYAASRPLHEPLLSPPDPAAFAASAELASAAPRLPPDVGTILTLLASAEIVLVLVLHSRRSTPWNCAAWLGAPAIAACAFLVGADRLPGALSATATALDGTMGRFVLVRVEARRAGHARFALPSPASSAAMIRYAPDDATVTSASAGREVALDLLAGESRLFAYVLRLKLDADGTERIRLSFDSPAPPVVPSGLSAWLAGFGLLVQETTFPPKWSLPTATGTVVVPEAHSYWVAPAK